MEPAAVLALPRKVAECLLLGCCSTNPPVAGLAVLFILLTAGLLKNNSFYELETVSDKIRVLRET